MPGAVFLPGFRARTLRNPFGEGMDDGGPQGLEASEEDFLGEITPELDEFLFIVLTGALVAHPWLSLIN